VRLLWAQGIPAPRVGRNDRNYSGVRPGPSPARLGSNRFNASFLGVSIVMLLLSPRHTTPVALIAPIAAIARLCLAAAGSPIQNIPFFEGTTFHDRLLFSGRILPGLDFFGWRGIEAFRHLGHRLCVRPIRDWVGRLSRSLGLVPILEGQ